MDIPASVQRLKDRLSVNFSWTPEVTDEFCRVLRDNNSVIAGSYPLQVLLDEEWVNSDVDIWISGEEEKFIRIFSFLMSHGAELPISLRIRNNKTYARLLRELKKAYQTRVSDFKTQLMVCKIPVEDVVANFDLTICRVAFNGETILLSETTRADILAQRLTTDGVNQTPFEWVRTLRRMMKYYTRGFTHVDYARINADLKRSQLEFDPDYITVDRLLVVFQGNIHEYIRTRPETTVVRAFVTEIEDNVVKIRPMSEEEIERRRGERE